MEKSSAARDAKAHGRVHATSSSSATPAAAHLAAGCLERSCAVKTSCLKRASVA
jgi:hypothetical protein